MQNKTIKVIRDRFQQDLTVVISKLNEQTTEFDGSNFKDLEQTLNIKASDSEDESSGSDIEELNLYTSLGSTNTKNSNENFYHVKNKSPDTHTKSKDSKKTSKTTSLESQQR